MKALTRAPWFGHAVVAAGVVVALGIVNVAWIGPREKERVALGATETALRGEIGDLQSGITEMAVWRSEHPHSGDGAMGVKTALPAGTMVASLLDALSALSERHGLRTQVIQPASAPVDEVVTDPSGATVVYRKVDLRLRFEAPFREVGDYLADVEGLGQLVVVRSVTLRYDALTSPRLVADVSLWTYGRP